MEFYFRDNESILTPKPRHFCSRCDKAIKCGVEVVQMWIGTEDFCISPGSAEVRAEWHRECFRREFDLRHQSRLYHCEQCEDRIQPGEIYRCFVVGSETDEWHRFAECRGKVLYNVEHETCYQQMRV
jgi:hypothetical protein